MISRVQRTLTAFAMVLAIWVASGSTALDQSGGGYGYNPGWNGPGSGGMSASSGAPISAVYGAPGYPFWGDGTSYGYGLAYGYPNTSTNLGFLAPVMRHRKNLTVHRGRRK